MSSSRNPLSFLKKKLKDKKNKKAAESPDHTLISTSQNDTPSSAKEQELPTEQSKQSTNQHDREKQEAAEAERLIAEQQRLWREEPWKLARPLETFAQGETFASKEARKRQLSEERRLVEEKAERAEKERRLAEEKAERAEKAFKGMVGEEVRRSSRALSEAELRGKSKEGRLEEKEKGKRQTESAESEARRKLMERIEEKRATKAPEAEDLVRQNAPTSSWRWEDGTELPGKLKDRLEEEANEAQRAKESAESEARRKLMERMGTVFPVAAVTAIPTSAETREGENEHSKMDDKPITPSVPRSKESPMTSQEPPKLERPKFPESTNTDFLSRAINIVKTAIEADLAADYRKAYKLYYQSLEYFMLASKWEKNPKSKELIRNKIAEYLERAEKLKEKFVDTPSLPRLRNQNVGEMNNMKRKESGEVEDERSRKAVEEVMIKDTATVKWEDVADHGETKEFLKENIMFPIKFPHLFTGARRLPWEGILLHGPSGCGKSHLVRSLATEAKCVLFSVNCSDLVSFPIRSVNGLVERIVATAKENRPAIIFFDRVDELHLDYDSVTEGIKKGVLENMLRLRSDNGGVFVFASTDRPWALPLDILKAFQRKIYLGLPDLSTRVKLFQMKLENTNCTMTPEDFEKLGRLCDGYCGSDIENAIQAAHFQPLKKIQAAEYFKKILSNSIPMFTPCAVDDEGAMRMRWTDVDAEEILEPLLNYKDLEMALETLRPSVSVADSKRHEEWANSVQHGVSRAT